MSGIRAYSRPMLRIETLVLVVIAYLVATANGSWWSAALTGRAWSDPASWLFLAACFITLVALHFALLAPLAYRWTVRPLLTVVVLVSVAAAYYMRTFAVLMDPSMIQNVLKTDTHEARELVSWSLVGSIVLWSAIPVAFIWWVRIERRPWLRSAVIRLGSVAGALLIAVLSILLVSRDITSMMRNQREMRYLITPGNLLYGLAASGAHGVRDVRTAREPVGTDARVLHLAMATQKPRVFVLIVGETARAANFSLLGYSRETTPELARLNVTAFTDVTSCGTSTEVSVPCMFSPFGREDYDERRIKNSEGLLNVLAHAGFAVKWLDNQSGCKGVCQGPGIDYQKLDAKNAPELCSGDECYDEILVRQLKAQLADIHGNTVIVLHMMGNHGPAYFRRYPAAYRRFTPDCATAELRKCSREEVVNAYDNAILYTDHVLAGVVNALGKESASLDTAMLYVSDHGESLGEKGMYLHGLPYAIAPSTQTHVPMIVWLSPGFTSAGEVDGRCLRGEAGKPLSHDNLFHSVLGLLDVQTTAYKSERDFFEPCRTRRGTTLARVDANPPRAK
jgi:lipid A ethanolaminephosphotransferase